MTLKQMSAIWGVKLSTVHAMAEKVNGGPLGRGRKKWTREQEQAIEVLIQEGLLNK